MAAVSGRFYLSDGVINLALLSYTSTAAAGVENLDDLVGARHEVNFERKFKDPDGVIFDISENGWVGNAE